MQQYEIRFWITNEQGFKEQSSYVWTSKKDKKDLHKQAIKETMKKFNLKKEDIISVVYC